MTALFRGPAAMTARETLRTHDPYRGTTAAMAAGQPGAATPAALTDNHRGKSGHLGPARSAALCGMFLFENGGCLAMPVPCLAG
jgi:hypothetical protein